jgi:hypothetical protein
MRRYLVTEAPTDVALLEVCLKPERAEHPLSFYAPESKSEAESVARSFLAVRHEPVVLVLNTNTNHPGSIEEQRDYFEGMLARGGPPEMWRVCLAIPEIESCFFDDLDFVERLFQTKLSEGDRVRAEFQPRAMLEKLFLTQNVPYTPEGIAQFLGDKDLSPIRESRLVREVREALDAVSAKPVG